MAKVVIEVATVKADFPVATVAGNFRFSILDSNGTVVQTQDTLDVSATFTGVADGDYTATAIRLDSNGVALGSGSSVNFKVSSAPSTVQIDVPSAISVSVSPE